MKAQIAVGPSNATYWNPKILFCNGCQTSRLEQHVFENQQACSFCMSQDNNTKNIDTNE